VDNDVENFFPPKGVKGFAFHEKFGYIYKLELRGGRLSGPKT
jgi:hypothetical protein